MKDSAAPARRTTAAAPASTSAAWWAIISLSIGAFGLVTAEFLPASLLTPMAGDLDVSHGVVGQAVTVTAVVAAIAGPLLVLGSGRLDRRKIVWGLMAALVASSILSASASSIVTLLVARALLGFALGSFWGMIASLAMRLVPPAQVPRAMSIIIMGVSLATVFAAPLGAFLGNLWGWRATFLAASGIGMTALAIQLLTLPRMPAASAVSLASFRHVLSQRPVAIGLGTTFLAVAGHFAGFTFIRAFLEDVPRLEISTISLALLVFGLGGFVGNLAGGAVATRSPGWAVAGASLLIAGAALMLVLLGTIAGVAFAATAVWGFAFGAFPVAISLWNAHAAADHTETAGAALSSMFQVAIATGAGFGGLIIDGAGARGVIVYTAASAFIGAGVMLVHGRAEKRRAARP